MAQMTIEFYADTPVGVREGAAIDGKLISSVDVTTASTTVAHAAPVGGASYIVVTSDFAAFIEIGSGNQDCTSTRRAHLLAGSARPFEVKGTDTVSYRSIA